MSERYEDALDVIETDGRTLRSLRARIAKLEAALREARALVVRILEAEDVHPRAYDNAIEQFDELEAHAVLPERGAEG